jgi:uncharacterized protein (TIGR02271 family)
MEFRRLASLQWDLLQRSVHQWFEHNPFWIPSVSDSSQRLERNSPQRRGDTMSHRISESAVLRSGDRPDDLDLRGDPAVKIVADDTVIPLLAEDLSVERRKVETGRLRVRRVTNEHVEKVDEELLREELEVERVPVGQIVETRPPVLETEDEIVIPLVEEVVVRRFLLKEEVHIRKKRTTERHREQVVLRTQDVLVARLPPKTSREED